MNEIRPQPKFAAPRRRYGALLALYVGLLIALAAPAATHAAARQRCFPETGFCASGAILEYWERNGGLPVFGYPISNQIIETIEGSWSGPTQWFERDRLEDHSNEAKGVLAGRLGDAALRQVGIDWQSVPGDNAVTPGCRFFRETQFNLCEPFLSYWEQNGGLERFGYPLTRQRGWRIEGRDYTVQYFERRRMEYHPEHAGTPYVIQLGLLGRDLSAIRPGQGVPPGDVSGGQQQAILDAAYAAEIAQGADSRLAVGLVEIRDAQHAIVLVQPFPSGPTGATAVTLDVVRQNSGWVAAPAKVTPSSDRYTVIASALAQLEDPRSQGMAVYVTRPRIAEGFARVWFAPGAGYGEGGSAFFKRDGDNWSFLTAGSLFTEDSLREMGVPAELWPYGEGVRGPGE